MATNLIHSSREDVVIFDTSIPHGKGVRYVQTVVGIELVVKLAAAYAVTKHAGHAVWHVEGNVPLPCSACRGR